MTTIPVEEAVPFGPKCAWLAIRGGPPADLEEVLGVTSVGECGWEPGVAKAYEWAEGGGYGKYLFATPDVEGWTLVVGTPLLAFADLVIGAPPPRPSPPTVVPFHELVVRLSKVAASEVHYFATHRVVEAHFWAMAVQGALVRAAGTADGTMAVDLGDWTDEEPDPLEAIEQDVFDLAGTWSVDPSELTGQFPRGQLYQFIEPPRLDYGQREDDETPNRSGGKRRRWWPF